MKIKVDIVTGFLGSGKTTFYKEYIKEKKIPKEKILYIQLEEGEEDWDGVINKKLASRSESLTSSQLLDWMNKHHPEYIVIETNGMDYLNDLFEILQMKSLKKSIMINNIYNCIHSEMISIYERNFNDLFYEQINNSNIMVLNFVENLSSEAIHDIKLKVAEYKAGSKIWILCKDKVIKKEDRMSFNKTFENSIPFFLGIFVLFIIYSSVNPYIEIEVYSTVFIGLLLEAIPFLLMGSMISAVIQVFVSEPWITKWFPQNKILGYVVALSAGVFFPVCDCAIIPIMRRLIKKGIPISIAITFMLSAPIVDPIVILSTFYAFWSNTMVVYFRIILGLIIALAVGLLFLVLQKDKDILKEDTNLFLCQCGYCQLDVKRPYGLKDKIIGVFQHGGAEFIGIGRFFIVAAMLSTAIQLYMPDRLVTQLGQQEGLSLIIMMAAAFIMSICSTSDAFLAQSLGSAFPLSSIMGFLVFGAMLDIKNLMILLTLFKKKFVFKLVGVITLVSLVVLYAFVLWM
ncbi:hypothetical protein EDC19_0183 [Natranaerovirga hydrolytica]|uniref:CobW/HypB/UreG nucleotide-binding domain-containing protein n=1 Tax=Natranaerovirga hydrolytica TaxID=680378 RepID=A0A4V2Q1I6_9FIRM|nr:permease [Natranaerovirga hydrolytica]TCK97781.1 hypothetical protein EDC19_0183 [Natranaerovirga hydrolytica]